MGKGAVADAVGKTPDDEELPTPELAAAVILSGTPLKDPLTDETDAFSQGGKQ